MESTGPYRTTGLWALLEEGLRAAGKDPAAATHADFQDVEQFHTGAARATYELLARLGDFKPHRVLDIGGGLGGPARDVASSTGATVIVAEPSEDFCDVGLRITQLAGLTNRIEFVRSDGVALPFPPGSFDLVWMQQAGMNIKDKHGLLAEISRVLEPGGRYLFQEIVAGPEPEPLLLPVPWAVTQDDSFLEPPGKIKSLCTSVGLSEIFFEDVTAYLAPSIRARTQLPPVGVHLLFAGDPQETPANVLRNIEQGRIAFVRGGFTKAQG